MIPRRLLAAMLLVPLLAASPAHPVQRVAGRVAVRAGEASDPAFLRIHGSEACEPGVLRVRFATPVAGDAEAAARVAGAAVGAAPAAGAVKSFPAPPSGRRPGASRDALDRWVQVRLPPGADLAEAVERWGAVSGVEIAEAIPRTFPALIPDDPLFPSQWEHRNTGANPGAPGGTPDADLDTEDAWDLVTGSVIVANAEPTQWFHPDLVPNVWQNAGEDLDGDGTLEWSAELGRWVFDLDDYNGVDDDGNGYINDYVGWNLSAWNNRPEQGTNSHGTATAGFLAARGGNALGLTGACPTCTFLAVAGDNPAAIVYAVDQGARVVSLSVSGLYSQAYADAVDYAWDLGALVVVAAGNSGLLGTSGLCHHDRVLCVTATTSRDRLVTLQNTGGWWGTAYGPEADVGAPGIQLAYLLPDGAYGTGGSGTSDATPLAAGSVALLFSANPALHPAHAISILQSTADPFVDADRFGGLGRVNAHAAVTAAVDAVAQGAPPLAILAARGSFITPQGTLDVRGWAASAALDRWELRVGAGLAPASWLFAVESGESVTDSLLLRESVRHLPTDTELRLELRAYDTSGRVARDVAFPLRAPNPFWEVEGWPLSVDSSAAGFALGDLDGDGPVELVLPKPGVTVVDIAGGPRTRWPTSGPSPVLLPPALGDLDGQPGAEVVLMLGATGDHRITVLEGTGATLDGWPRPVGAYVLPPPSLGDIDGDGADEIVSFAWNASLQPVLRVFEADGEECAGFPVTLSGLSAFATVLPDLDGDGDREIVARRVTSLRAWNGDGSEVAGWAVPDSGAVLPFAADLDRDGRDEIVTAQGGAVHAYGPDAVELPGWPVLGAVVTRAMAGDVDGDTFLEIVTQTADWSIHAFEADGTACAGFPLAPAEVGELMALADVDDDGAVEVILRWNGRIRAFDAGSADAAWTVQVPETVSEVRFADTDADGDLEMLLARILPSGPSTFRLFDLGPSRPGEGWLHVHADTKNSRRAPLPGSATTAVPAAAVPARWALHRPRPNPASDRVEIAWNQPAPGNVRVSVHDVAGRLVCTVSEGWRPAGGHRVVWRGDGPAGPAAAGVYFVRLEAAGRRDHARIVRIR